ncbi:MAG: GNAT family N-acetyltransferase [Pseudomonadota bacterium]
MRVQRATTADDLASIVDAINAAQWDDANAIEVYEATALAAYLERQDTVFLTCHEGKDVSPLLGMASARIEMKPYGRGLWLYVDEMDVCVDHRRRGVGQALMTALLQIAEDAGCEELWLGTEVDNTAANALYTSMQPDAVDRLVGYTYETD